MSKQAVIPSNTKPMWMCEINGKVYSYTAGTTQTVPDEVADLIANYNNLQPTEAAEQGTAGQVYTKETKGARFKDISLPIAQQTKYGVVKMGAAVSDATSETAVTQLNALLTSLRNAGIIYVEPEENSDD